MIEADCQQPDPLAAANQRQEQPGARLEAGGKVGRLTSRVGHQRRQAARKGIGDEFVNGQLIKRLGRMEDLANMALFLCSEEANFITGQTMVIDGGQFFH